MACEAADRIASFTTMGPSVRPDECTPSRPVPLWTFTGDPDRYAVTALVDKGVAINGCDPDPVVGDLNAHVTEERRTVLVRPRPGGRPTALRGRVFEARQRPAASAHSYLRGPGILALPAMRKRLVGSMWVPREL